MGEPVPSQYFAGRRHPWLDSCLDNRQLSGCVSANEAEPPLRFLAGSIALSAAEQKFSWMRAELDKWRELCASTDGEFGSMSVDGLMDQMR
jgi:hypothetical protein